MFPKYDRPFYFHFYKGRGRDDLGKSNGVTICLLPTEGNEFIVGSATCASMENFCRKKGRSIALQRAQAARAGKLEAKTVQGNSLDDLRAVAEAEALEACKKAR